MALNLNLKDSEAKVARARIHLETLQGEIGPSVSKGNLYSYRVGEVDKDGWCRIYMTPHKIGESELGIIVGDIVHNLRCALDYIISALVNASPGATLSNKHQFPIHVDEGEYRRLVGDKSSVSSKNSPLYGIISAGLEEVWNRQPFHRQPYPVDEPTYFVRVLSNADKHRVIASAIPQDIDRAIELVHDGRIVEAVDSWFGSEWKADEEREVKRVCFERPYPAKIDLKGDVTVMVQFTTPPFLKDHLRNPVRPDTLNAMCDYVAAIVERFKAI